MELSMISQGNHLNERRAESRTATVFRPVLIEASGFTGFCLVRNLSSNGLMGDIYTAFSPGTEVTIQCGPSVTITGVIAWSEHGQVGIEFDEAINVDYLLLQMGRTAPDGKPNRAPRLELRTCGVISIEGRDLECELQNISQKGLKILCSYIMPGDVIDISLPGLSRKRAQVCWSQNGTAGLNFLSPIPFNELALWVIEQNLGSVKAGKNVFAANEAA